MKQDLSLSTLTLMRFRPGSAYTNCNRRGLITRAGSKSPHFRVNLRPGVTHFGDVSRRPGCKYPVTTMLTVANGRGKVFTAFLVSIGLLAAIALSIAIGVHAFLTAVGHYAPWEQIWAG